MDADADIDAQLMQQFRSLGTQDKEILMTELQRVLGNQLDLQACAFFLEMNSWNLQAAVGAYYDNYDQNSTVALPKMVFVKDVTIGEGESVRPGVQFVKTWRIKNTGDGSWPPGCSLRFLLGHQLGPTERVLVEALPPNAECDISIVMTSPSTPGIYHGQWQMSSPTGALFGEVIWVILQVSEDGLLDITQEMSRFGSELRNSPKDVIASNPFSPSSSSIHLAASQQTPSSVTPRPLLQDEDEML